MNIYHIAFAAAALTAGSTPTFAATIDFEDRGVGLSTSQTFGDYRISSPVSFWINTTSGTKALFPAMIRPPSWREPTERPEPSAWALLILGFGAVGGNMRQGKTRRPAAA